VRAIPRNLELDETAETVTEAAEEVKTKLEAAGATVTVK
jgi:ribosomal protein L7/L12